MLRLLALIVNPKMEKASLKLSKKKLKYLKKPRKPKLTRILKDNKDFLLSLLLLSEIDKPIR